MSDMQIVQIQLNILDIWSSVSKLVYQHSSWNAIAKELRISKRALVARRERLSPDVSLIMRILDSLMSDMYVLVPESKEEYDSNPAMQEAKKLMECFVELRKEDKELVKTLVARLRKTAVKG